MYKHTFHKIKTYVRETFKIHNFIEEVQVLAGKSQEKRKSEHLLL